MDLKLPVALPGALMGAGAADALPTAEGAADFASGLAAFMNIAPSGGASSPLASLLPATPVTPATATSKAPGKPADLPAALGALAALFSSAQLKPAESAQPKPATTAAVETAQAGAQTPVMGLLAALMATTAGAAKSSVSAETDEPDTRAAVAQNDEAERPGPGDLLGLLMTLNQQPTTAPMLPGAPQPQLVKELLSTAAAALTSGMSTAPATSTASTASIKPTTQAIPQAVLSGQGGSSSPLAGLFADITPVATDAGAAAQFMDSIAAQLGIDPASASLPSSLRAVADVMLGATGVQAPAERSSAMSLPAAPLDIRQPQAPQRLADSVVWHLDQGIQEVHIRLNPEELGPLEVKLRMDGEKVAVRFDMADASVRDVVQTSLPNLASLLSARGLMLDQAQVFSQGQGQPRPESQFLSGGDAQGEEAAPVARPISRRGLIDDYV